MSRPLSRQVRSRSAVRPQLEVLEDRCLLSAGDLDPTFGVGGIARTDFTGNAYYGGDRARDLVIQNDGKIILSGGGGVDLLLARYNTDGTLDSSFDQDGKVAVSFGSGRDNGYAMALQSDGKIVVAGFAETSREFMTDMLVARFNVNGSLDKSFGKNGKVVLSTTNNLNGQYTNQFETFNAVTVLGDGKILAGGTNGTDAFFARFTANGSLDNSFGNRGKVVLDVVPGNYDQIVGFAIQSDGKIVANAGWFDNWFTLRLNANGSLDSSFGSNGQVSLAGVLKAGFDAVRIDGNGRIVIAGHVPTAHNDDFAVARLTANGSLDPTFNSSGAVPGVATADSAMNDVCWAIALQADGKIVAAGEASGDFGLARFNSDGTLDSSFGNAGFVITAVSTEKDEAYAVAVQPDGKIVAGGFSNFPDADFAVVRYLGDDPLLAASTPAHARSATITVSQAQPLLAEALRRWQAAGVDTSYLGTIQLQVTNLGGRTLGFASGRTITLDDNAAGWGWFVDKTPWEDSEFAPPLPPLRKGGSVADRMDLLSVLTHEVGHLLGFDHGEPGASATGVMNETLAAGVRSVLADQDSDLLSSLAAWDLSWTKKDKRR